MEQQRPRWAMLLILVTGVGVYNWWSRLNGGFYYPTAALATPWLAVILTAYLIYPPLAIEPRDRKTAIAFWSVMGLGFLLGCFNAHLISR